jgi:MinD superfamily P-loop ATPase
MIISVASGKGGTGKTLVSTNLVLSIDDRDMQFLDCDIEEPNAYIFLKPEIKITRPVEVLVPQFNEEKCTHCKKCSDFCAYSAILVSPKKVQLFPELCHSCGGCALICPEGAISEVPFKIGNLYIGQSKNIDFVYGELDVSRPLAVPVIKEVKTQINTNKTVIIDSPPGASCPVIEAVKGSDFVILVTEPTPFGLHDLTIAVEVVSQLNIPMGVVVNRSDLGSLEVWDFLAKKEIPVLLEIPFDKQIAELYSKGIPFSTAEIKWRDKFRTLFQNIERLVSK